MENIGWQAVIELWFGTGKLPSNEERKRWFVSSTAFDQEIQEKFLPLLNSIDSSTA